LGAASQSSEIEQDLPLVLYEQLENGAFGRDYLIQLDKGLFGV
jgi:ADP-ribosyl-[dinitrogen reductase] hydrolase